jgi:hypothetical protein
MLKIKKILASRTGIIIFSIILGLGLSSIFKASCDSGNCIVYKAPDFNLKKIIKYNNKCYDPVEHIETCDTNKKIVSF